MVNPVKDLSISANTFGGQLSIMFELPDSLPTNWKFYMFRRSGTDVTQAEIDDYFTNIDNLASFNYNGLFVFDNFDPNDLDATGTNVYPDYKVLSKKTYFYKAVVRDETSKEYSTTVNANGVPIQTIKVNIKDGKELVAEAIKKMFDNILNADGKKVKLSRDIKVVKNFAIEPIGDNYVMIERVNGSVNQRYWGQQYSTYQGGIIKGEVDNDVIRATFMTSDGNDRRDLVTNIFRAQKQFLMQYIKKLADYQVQDVSISIEGDYMNPQIHGVNHIGVNIVFALIIQNIVYEEGYKLTDHITDSIEVDNG